MKRVSIAVALLLVFGATSARADRWVPRKRLPKPIDFPIVRKNVKEYHKQNKKQNHPPEPTASLPTAAGTANA